MPSRRLKQIFGVLIVVMTAYNIYTLIGRIHGKLRTLSPSILFLDKIGFMTIIFIELNM